MADSPNIDYGGVHKFFVSVGTLVIGAAALTGWALLQKFDVLLAPQKVLGDLTPSARETVEAQQQLVGGAVHLWIWIVGAIVLFGSALVVIGLVRWWPLQRMENALKKHDHDVQLGIASPAEMRDKQNEEATVELVEQAAGAVFSAPQGRRTVTIRTPEADLVRERATTEAELISAAEVAFSSDHRTARDVRITDEDGRIVIVDLLLTSTTMLAKNYVVEFKRLNANMSYERFRETIFHTERAATLLSPQVSGMIFTRVVFLVDGDADTSRYSLPSGMRKKTRVIFLWPDDVVTMLEHPVKLHTRIA